MEKVLFEGKFLEVLNKDTWEFVRRVNCEGIVVIAALTNENKVLFVDQYRIPMAKRVIELPAGLIGDQVEFKGESFETGAKRELLEETGYAAKEIKELITGPVSSGMSSEVITFCLASGLKKVGDGGGDETEDIVVHEVPLDEAERWIFEKQKEGYEVDPKVFTGLYFLKRTA